jgi:hypothetical protein
MLRCISAIKEPGEGEDETFFEAEGTYAFD